VTDLIAHDKAASGFLEGLLVDADKRLDAKRASRGIYLFKNNTDSRATPTALPRELPVGGTASVGRLAGHPIPFHGHSPGHLRCGKVVQTRGAFYCVSQRASTSGKRFVGDPPVTPIIKHPDEPHADAERSRCMSSCTRT